MTNIRQALRNLIFTLIWVDFALMYHASAVAGNSPLSLVALILMALLAGLAVFVY